MELLNRIQPMVLVRLTVKWRAGLENVTQLQVAQIPVRITLLNSFVMPHKDEGENLASKLSILKKN